MAELLLIVLGCYVAAAALVHLAFWMSRGRRRASKHYVFIADHRQDQMEWYLRSLFAFSRRMGTDVRLTVVDRGATEDTKAIVEKWGRDGKKVSLHTALPEAKGGEEDRKRLQPKGDQAVHLMWMLQEEGIVSETDHAVLVDLQNPTDLSKMPF